AASSRSSGANGRDCRSEFLRKLRLCPKVTNALLLAPFPPKGEHTIQQIFLVRPALTAIFDECPNVTCHCLQASGHLLPTLVLPKRAPAAYRVKRIKHHIQYPRPLCQQLVRQIRVLPALKGLPHSPGDKPPRQCPTVIIELQQLIREDNHPCSQHPFPS